MKRDREERGFTLIELLVSVVVFSILLAAFFVFFRSQALALSQQERFLNAKQNAQIGIDFMMRELRTAGSRPTPEAYPNPGCAAPPCCAVAASSASICFGINGAIGFPSLATADGTSLRLLGDYRGNNTGDAPDGCPDDAGEDITYSYVSATGRLMRQVGSGTAAPVLEGIASTNGFRVRYYGYGTGSPPPFVEFQSGGGNLTANEIARLTHIVITVTTQATSRIPGLPAITSTQTSTVDMRNPAC